MQGQQQRAATVEEIIEKRIREDEVFSAVGVSEGARAQIPGLGSLPNVGSDLPFSAHTVSSDAGVASNSPPGEVVVTSTVDGCGTSLAMETRADMHLATPVRRRGRPKRRVVEGDENAVGEFKLPHVPSSVSEPDRSGSASLITEGEVCSTVGQGVSATDSIIFAADQVLGMSEVSLSGVTTSGEGGVDQAITKEGMAGTGVKVKKGPKASRRSIGGHTVGRTKGGRGKMASKVYSGVGKKKANALAVANQRKQKGHGDTDVCPRKMTRSSVRGSRIGTSA